MNEDLDFVGKVKLFNEISGNIGEFDIRKTALYVGLVAEEFGEMLESLNSESYNEWVESLNALSREFKNGSLDNSFENINRVEFLDACVDISVVSIGAGIAVGGDVVKACNKVADNNLEKFEIVDGKHTVLMDENGKVKKPPNYKSVELSDCIK